MWPRNRLTPGFRADLAQEVGPLCELEEGTVENPLDQSIGVPGEGAGNSETKVRVGAGAREWGKFPSLINKEYKDLRDVFSEKRSDELPPHRPTDCSIEILPGAKLPKPKLYSMSPQKLED